MAVDNLLAVGVPVDNLLALPTQRRVGKLMTVTAVDWAVKEIVEGLDSAQAKECIEEEHANLVKSSVDWLGGKLFSAAKTKMYGNEMIVQTEVQQINARVKLAIENAVQPCAIDVADATRVVDGAGGGERGVRKASGVFTALFDRSTARTRRSKTNPSPISPSRLVVQHGRAFLEYRTRGDRSRRQHDASKRPKAGVK